MSHLSAHVHDISSHALQNSLWQSVMFLPAVQVIAVAKHRGIKTINVVRRSAQKQELLARVPIVRRLCTLSLGQ